MFTTQKGRGLVFVLLAVQGVLGIVAALWVLMHVPATSTVGLTPRSAEYVRASHWNRLGRALGCPRDTGVDGQPVAEAMDALSECLEEQQTASANGEKLEGYGTFGYWSRSNSPLSTFLGSANP